MQRLPILVALALVLSAWLSVSGCSKSDSKSNTPVDGDENACDIETISETAKLPTGVQWKDEAKGEVEWAKIHTGQLITPQGIWTKVGTMPTGSALSADGSRLAVVCSGGKDFDLENKNNQSVQIIDTASAKVIKVMEEQETFMGIAFSPDGKRLYVSGGLTDTIYVYDAENDFTKIADWKLEGYPFGLTTTHDGKYLLVAVSHRSQVYKLDAASGEVLKKLDALTYPWEIVVDADDHFAYVSNIGNDAVSILDLQTDSTVGHVSVEKNPEGLALYNGKLFVANNDTDTISVIDIRDKSVTQTINLRENENDPPGRLPVDLLVDAEARRLYVTLAADNALAVISLEDYSLLGEIPTGFYPTAVELFAGRLYVTNAKGLGSGPHMDGEGASVGIFFGGVNSFQAPTDEELAATSEQVRKNNHEALTYFHSECDNWNSPIPTAIGTRSEQIKHVVYIIKENKTYDVLMGDMAGDAGDKWHDPTLAYFGEDETIAVHGAPYGPETRYNITPNAHALARRYVDMVNFYDNSVKSTEGHMWLSGGWLNDFGEKFSLLWQVRGERNFMLPNIDPVSTPGTGTLFSWLINHGRSIRIYGEFVGSGGEIFADGFDYVAAQYQAGITVYDDTLKIKVFENEFKNGIFRDFTFIWIPNDHTFGMDAGKPHPAYMVADNDEALGRLVDMISHSEHWKETVIFAFQDDPQNTPDHIDEHRSILHVASPWVKRGYMSEIHYDMASVHRTMLQILGLPPISRYEARAQPMYDIFTTVPDFTPYTFIPHDEKFNDKSQWLNPDDSELARMSAKMNFGMVDDQGGLGYVLWRAMKGDAEYPAHLISDGVEAEEEEALERRSSAVPDAGRTKGGE